MQIFIWRLRLYQLSFLSAHTTTKMDYSPLLSQIEHPLLDFDDDSDNFQKINLNTEPEELNAESQSTVITTGKNVSGGFFRRSKSKTDELSTPTKKSSPIEIKGSPSHHKSQNNKEKEQQHGSNSSNSGSSRMSFLKVLTRRNSSTNQGKHKSK